jgi:murein DD-endopeptidase MepM/ murein hydrolase activator NlpD
MIILPAAASLGAVPRPAPLVAFALAPLSILLAACSGSSPGTAATGPVAASSASVTPTSESPSETPTQTPTTTTPSPHPRTTTAVPTRTTSSPAPTTSLRFTARGRYVFPVARCSSSYSSSHHDYPASDIFTSKGCPFVAVTAGRVDEVSYVDRWDPNKDYGATRGGLSVSIVGDDGVRYYGSHLEKIAAGISPGARVTAGQVLGLIDNTGDAKYVPTHVHFGISWPTKPGAWWVRRGEIWPQRYLASWRAGGDLSPAPEVRRVHAQMGDVPPCRAEC